MSEDHPRPWLIHAASWSAFRRHGSGEREARTAKTFPQLFVFFVGALCIFLQAYRVPVNPTSPGLDRSYPHVLNLFAFTPMRFGTDLVYTYGPLGFLMHVENVHHNLVLGFIFWTALYAAFSLCATSFVVRLTSGFAQLACLIAAIWVAGFIDAERLIPYLVLVLLLLSFENQKSKPWIICGALSSIALMMRFPIGVACIGMTIGAIVWPLEWRRISKHLSIYAISVLISSLLLWTVTSGSIDGIAAYVANSLQLTSAYTAVLSSARIDEGASLRLFLVALALLLTMTLLLPRSRRVPVLLVMAFPLFVAWKSGVVRFDGHIIALVDTAVLAGFLLCVLHLSPVTMAPAEAASSSDARRWSRLRPAVATALFFLACIALDKGLARMTLTTDAHPLLSRSYTEGLGGVKDRWIPGLVPLEDAWNFRQYRNRLDSLAAANLAPVTLKKELLDRIGHAPVDIYSSELGFVAANPELNYRPKPVFQHFNAFTETLDRLNASFFASPARPDFLIMHHPVSGLMDGVDGRHPLFDDPIAFPEIMRSYKTVFVEDDPRNPQMALLQHVGVETADRFSQPRAIKDEVVRWSEDIALPMHDNASVLRAKIELRENAVAAVKEALFRLGPVYLVYILADGTRQRYRLLPTHWSSGVWVSPLFENYRDLYAFLGSKPWIGPKVVAIRFENENSREYPASFKLTWESIECAGRGCGPAESRVFDSTVRSPGSAPVPIAAPVQASVSIGVASISAIDVRLSTYAKINHGVLTMQILDANGTILRESKVDAASVQDNQYQRFPFEPLSDITGSRVELRLTYAAEKDGMLAAWRTSTNAPDFDFRVYGH